MQQIENNEAHGAEYEAPLAVIRDIKIDQAFLQTTGSAGGFGDPGGGW